MANGGSDSWVYQRMAIRGTQNGLSTEYLSVTPDNYAREAKYQDLVIPCSCGCVGGSRFSYLLSAPYSTVIVPPNRFPELNLPQILKPTALLLNNV